VEILGLDDWLAWFLLGVGLLVVELLVAFTFYAAPVALGAFAAAIVAALGDSVEPQLIAFIIGSSLSLVILRPLVRRHLLPPEPEKRSNVHVLVGHRAVPLERVDVDRGTARIGEDVWSARTLAEETIIEEGDRAEVVAVRGVYAYLEPAKSKPATAPEAEPDGEDP
jgi:membrane protein implicated in regulation of membrane protease activity